MTKKRKPRLVASRKLEDYSADFHNTVNRHLDRNKTSVTYETNLGYVLAQINNFRKMYRGFLDDKEERYRIHHSIKLESGRHRIEQMEKIIEEVTFDISKIKTKVFEKLDIVTGYYLVHKLDYNDVSFEDFLQLCKFDFEITYEEASWLVGEWNLTGLIEQHLERGDRLVVISASTMGGLKHD